MANQVILDKSVLTGIGDAIRSKEGSTEAIPSVDMASRILNLPTGGIDGSFNINGGDNTDAQGHWHKPDDWDDIESIDLTGKHECYFLCGTKLSDYPFFSIRCYGGGTLKWCYGHVSNGVFTIHPNSTEKTFSSAAYLRLFLGNIEDDYIVVRITATSYLTSVETQSWSSTTDLPYAMSYTNNCILMRYGRLYRGTSLKCRSYYLQSDHMVDFGEYYQNSSTTMSFSEAYSLDFSLQRVRYSGTTDFSKLKITSLASMFYNCFMLSDFENDTLDMTGWVSSTTTSVASMFNACWSLKAKLIVTNWNMNNITNASYLFYNCRSVKEIEGLETWNSFNKITTALGIFYWCCCWQKDCLDISSWNLGNGTSALTNVSYLFHSCYGLKKVILNNMNLSNCTTLNAMFYSSGIKEIEWGDNFIPPSSACTDYSSVFQYCFALTELYIKGWDFSKAANGKLNSFIYYMYNTRKIVFEDCVTNTVADTSSSVFCRYDYNLRYFDVSWLDFSKFSNTTFFGTGWDTCYQVVDFYPPQNINKALKFTNWYNLSHESLLRIMANLSTVTTKTTLTLGAYNLAKLTDIEKAIATGKGWTLA